jgi:hypothetical protein
MKLVALGGVVALGGGAASGIAAHVPAAATLVRSVDTANASEGGASTAVATSVSFTVDLHAHIPPHDGVHLVVRGQMNFVRHTLTATVTLPLPTLPASASEAGALPEANSLTVQTEWVNRHAYMSVPPAWAALAGGARILSLPTSSSLRRIVATTLTQSAVALTYAKLLLDELTDDHSAHRAGSRSIGGVPATGTQVELTLANLLKLVPELSPSMTKDVARMADQTIPATVWVDHQGRLVEVDLADPKGTPASVAGTVRFSDYGAPAPAALPPATTVQPIPPALLQLLGGWYYF